ncbi:malonyl-CoA decarboxylase domain-containing protein [Siccirubricoccus deserti]
MAEPVEAFQALTAEGWPDDPAREAALRPVLLRLAAAYLTRPNAGMGGIDPVARFHLGNGAQLERVNWLGNRAARGLQESYGIMVNYLYDREAIEANHEAFIRSGQVARSPAVEVLLTPPRPAPAGRFALGRLLGGEERGRRKRVEPGCRGPSFSAVLPWLCCGRLSRGADRVASRASRKLRSGFAGNADRPMPHAASGA